MKYNATVTPQEGDHVRVAAHAEEHPGETGNVAAVGLLGVSVALDGGLTVDYYKSELVLLSAARCSVTASAVVDAGPVMPVAYVVAERRPWTGDPNWIFGDEWNAWHTSLDEAQAAAESWQGYPDHIAVFAVVPVTGVGGED